MADIEDAINDSIAACPDGAVDPVHLAAHPRERVECVDLLRVEAAVEAADAAAAGEAPSGTPPDELFRKVMAAFVALCDEAVDLRANAKARFLPALAMFGQEVDEDDWDGKVRWSRL